MPGLQWSEDGDGAASSHVPSHSTALTKMTSVVEKGSRHRARNGEARVESPEGFWRSDFPTTQEVEREHEIAAQKRRAIAQGRLQQAVLGGRYIFRNKKLHERFERVEKLHPLKD